MKKTVLTILGLVLIVIGVIAYSSMFTVHQTQQALILQFGNPIRTIPTPGLQFKLPFVQNVEYYDRRILDLDPPVQEVILFDQKRINVDAFARYKIVDPLEFRKRAGYRYDIGIARIMQFIDSENEILPGPISIAIFCFSHSFLFRLALIRIENG